MDDKNTLVIDLVVIKILSKATEYGDYKRLNWILETCFGRMVPDDDKTIEKDDDVKSIADLVKKFSLE